ncbi:MAG: TlpA family protein disulfide reductase [Acidobacteria bacterium]|nr:TlpA family protein disulfide reductase [Acidobacteriota bacterium]
MRLLMIAAAMAASVFAADLKPVDEVSYPKVVAAAKGKVVLVNFWATYCVPCRKEMPQLVALAAKYKAKGLEFVTISADEPEQAKDAATFLDKAGVPAPAYIRKAKDDDKFVVGLDAKWNGALPASFLYDRTGKKVRAFFGEVKIAELEAALQKLL